MYSSIISPQSHHLQPKPTGDAYLKIQLEAETLAVLSMNYAQEVVVVPPGQITPIPHKPACVWGLLNRRNKLLWAVDLAHMLELQPLDANTQQYNVVIIRVGQAPLALVVQEVQGVTRFMSAAIQSPLLSVAPGLTPYLRGCILQQTDILLVLDAEAIVKSQILHSN